MFDHGGIVARWFVAMALAIAAITPALAEHFGEKPLVAAGSPGAPPLPPGSFVKTCHNVELNAVRLTAQCKMIGRGDLPNEIEYIFCHSPLENIDGTIQCQFDAAASQLYGHNQYLKSKAALEEAQAKQKSLEQIPIDYAHLQESIACLTLGFKTKLSNENKAALDVLGDKMTSADDLALVKWFETGYVKTGRYKQYCGHVFTPDEMQRMMADWLKTDPSQTVRRRDAVRFGFMTVLGRDATTNEAYDWVGKPYYQVVTDVAAKIDKFSARATFVYRAFAVALGRKPTNAEWLAWSTRKEYYDQIISALAVYLYDGHGYPNPDPGYLELVDDVHRFTDDLKGAEAPYICYKTAIEQARGNRIPRSQWTAFSLTLPPECLKTNLFYSNKHG